MHASSEVMGDTNRRHRDLVAFLFVPMGNAHMGVMRTDDGLNGYVQFDVGLQHRRYTLRFDRREAELILHQLTTFLKSDYINK